jgi:hypothetical protein
MRTRTDVISCVIALALLLSSLSAFAQSMADERAAIWAHIRTHSRGSILHRPPVLEAPFSGEAVTTWRPPSNSGRHEVSVTTRYYRDRAGRVRVEQPLVGQARGQSRERVIVTPDLSKPWVYLLDPVARTASRTSRSGTPAGPAVQFVLPVTMTCVIHLFRPGLHRPLEEESLGEQTLHGLRVEGTRVMGMLNAALGPGNTTDERWFSPELQLEMYARSEDEQIGVVEYEVTRISRGEPPAALFEEPVDYELDAVYRGGTSLNPYATEVWPKLSASFKSSCGSATPPGF